VIVRDGWPFLVIGAALVLATAAGAVRWSSLGLLAAAGLCALLTLFTAYFFRNPPRVVPDDPRAVVAPADGKVVLITPLEDHPALGGPATRISIFLSVFDVHINRIPTAGAVDYVKYNPGRFFAAFADKASELNEQTEVGLTTPRGARLAVAQIAGLIARRIVCRLRAGDTVRTGAPFGMIRFGSRTDLTIPAAWEVTVRRGEHVKGGETIMALMPAAAARPPADGFADSPREAHDSL